MGRLVTVTCSEEVNPDIHSLRIIQKSLQNEITKRIDTKTFGLLNKLEDLREIKEESL